MGRAFREAVGRHREVLRQGAVLGHPKNLELGSAALLARPPVLEHRWNCRDKKMSKKMRQEEEHPRVSIITQH